MDLLKKISANYSGCVTIRSYRQDEWRIYDVTKRKILPDKYRLACTINIVPGGANLSWTDEINPDLFRAINTAWNSTFTTPTITRAPNYPHLEHYMHAMSLNQDEVLFILQKYFTPKNGTAIGNDDSFTFMGAL